MPRFLRFTFFALLACLLTGPVSASADEDVNQITHLLKSTFDRPDAPLHAAPVVVVANHAIADWSQDERGGRALLRQHHGSWSIVLCSGDALKDEKFLNDAGVPSADALALAKALAEAETDVTPERLAQFSLFDGTVRMDEGGEHGSHP
tara:strand:+ start:3826 stop:4272 length:447 start_codon:yes stop_codon:yes gene_type:complete